ncbi:MAG: diguanylate cyclase [Burkholderiaceae bacterium]|nr:diguanylate cyclase [Burkholderiaceae bacterium]HMN65645.1 GGDEF domain-containing protein [Burkholderiaceae bacterium]
MTMVVLPDIPTVYMLTGFSSLVGAGILIWLRRDHRESSPALTLFAAGIFALGIGFLSFAAREAMDGWLAPLVGYSGFGVSAALIWLGSRQLYGLPGLQGRVIVAGIALAGYIAALFAIREPTAAKAIARITLNGVFVIAFMGLAAWEAHRSRWLAPLRSVRLIRALLVLFCAIVAVRMIAFLVQGIPLHTDGSAPPGALRAFFAVVFGSMPFAITVSVLGISNSQLSTRLHQMATTDDLTGLVSRRSLQESANRLLGQAPDSGCIALLMIDVDNFKTINDRHGHTIGDHVLRHVANVLRQSLRPDSLIVRYGGDEFCALVPVPGEAAAFVVAERLRATMEASPYRLDSQRIPVTLSIGVSVHRHGKTLRQLLDEADRRAYRAKADGRNRVVADDLPLAA